MRVPKKMAIRSEANEVQIEETAPLERAELWLDWPSTRGTNSFGREEQRDTPAVPRFLLFRRDFSHQNP